jgi:hypothetical protein
VCTSYCSFLARLRIIGPIGAGDNVGEVAGVVAEDVDVVDIGMVISPRLLAHLVQLDSLKNHLTRLAQPFTHSALN